MVFLARDIIAIFLPGREARNISDRMTLYNLTSKSAYYGGNVMFMLAFMYIRENEGKLASSSVMTS